MANPCYEPLGFEEILVEGVPITRNCLHESCFEIEVAGGFLTEALNDIYPEEV